MVKATVNSLAFFISVLFVINTQAAVPISVAKFDDKTGYSNCRLDWDWWKSNFGDGFKEMLITELAKSNQVEIFEREIIHQIYQDEHNLINSEEDNTIKKGQFKKARYTLAGSVTEFEYCASKKSGSVNVGMVAGLFGVSSVPDLSVGVLGASAKIGIDLRVIDTQTGRVIKSIHTTANAEDKKFSVDSNYGDFASQENSPMGKAAREAISMAAVEALKSLSLQK